MKKTYLLISFLIVISVISSYVYYQSIQKSIPKNIVKSNETIFNVDKIRFTFKVGCTSRKALNSLYSAKIFQNEDYIQESIEYCEAAIAFAKMNYTKDEKLLNFVVPKLRTIISIIEDNGIRINNNQLVQLINIFDEINRFSGNREKEIWANIQQNYIEFRTNEEEKISLYKTIILISVLMFIIIGLSLFFRQKAKSKANLLIQKLHYAADEALNGYWEWHLDSNYMYMSRGWKDFLGYKEDELKSDITTFKELVHPDDLAPTMNIANQYFENKKDMFRAKFRLKHKDGTFKWVSSVGAVIEGKENIFFGFHIDIDDLTTTKETLIAQSKSAMMGEMVGAIAHQIKQPMSVISMLASNQLASIELEENITPDMIRNDANENLKQVLFLSDTIDTFKNFLKPDKQKVNTSIESILESSLNILNKSLKNNSIEVIKHFSNTNEISAYNSELMQVFINIISNSKDAFKINNIPNRIISISTIQKENSVIVKIEDNAGGIPDNALNKIFDAYFTTKEAKGGTGLGLYIVKTIIEEHYNGSISIENSENGVVFIITLPS